MLMIPAFSGQLPFTSGEALVVYQPASIERYFPVGPGIEASIEPWEEPIWGEETGQESLVYNGSGRLNHGQKKGVFIDTLG